MNSISIRTQPSDTEIHYSTGLITLLFKESILYIKGECGENRTNTDYTIPRNVKSRRSVIFKFNILREIN